MTPHWLVIGAVGRAAPHPLVREVELEAVAVTDAVVLERLLLLHPDDLDRAVLLVSRKVNLVKPVFLTLSLPELRHRVMVGASKASSVLFAVSLCLLALSHHLLDLARPLGHALRPNPLLLASLVLRLRLLRLLLALRDLVLGLNLRPRLGLVREDFDGWRLPLMHQLLEHQVPVRLFLPSDLGDSLVLKLWLHWTHVLLLNLSRDIPLVLAWASLS